MGEARVWGVLRLKAHRNFRRPVSASQENDPDPFAGREFRERHASRARPFVARSRTRRQTNCAVSWNSAVPNKVWSSPVNAPAFDSDGNRGFGGSGHSNSYG